MGCSLVGRLVVAAMTQIAKIAERMLRMPGSAISVDGMFGLRFMTVLALGGLGSALCFYGRGGQQEDAERQKEQPNRQEEE